MAIAPDTSQRLRQFPKTPIDYDHSLLDERETGTLALLIEAARELNGIYARQVAEEVPSMRERLARRVAERHPEALAALEYFDIQAGPWDRLMGDEPFIGTRAKPKGAGFYPVDMTREELERWIASHPQDKEAFQGLFTVIRRGTDGKLKTVPYTVEYKTDLAQVAKLLAQANCASCHGKNFSTPIDPTYSKLAGQHADYLYVALKSYQTEHNPRIGRNNAIMMGMARPFTHSEIKALSNYLSSLPGELKTVQLPEFR